MTITACFTMEISTLVLPSVLSDVGHYSISQVYDVMRSWLLTVKSPSLIASTIMPVVEFICNISSHGWKLMGDGPSQNLRWGTAHVSVPPIFREVVLLDAYELSKKRCNQGIFCSEMEAFLVKQGVFSSAKGHIYIRFQTVKKVIRNFWRQNGNFFPKNRSF